MGSLFHFCAYMAILCGVDMLFGESDYRLTSHFIVQQIRQMIADVDKDGSGAIDFDEFVHMMTAKIGERDSKEELMKAFHIIDQDKNVKF